MTTPRKPRPNRRATIRWLAAAAALALVLGNLATWAHHIAVRHQVCLEHGGLSHIADDDESQAHSSAWDHMGDDDYVGWRSHPIPLGFVHTHTHCVNCTVSRDRLGVVAASHTGTAQPSSDGISSTAPSTQEPVRIAVYRLAPKHSPPA